eukprot:361993_1
MSHGYSRSKHLHENAYGAAPNQHSYNPSIHPETFELENFAADLIQKECDGYIGSCESLKRIGIILNKYRSFIIKHNNAYSKNANTAKANNKRLGLVGLNKSKHQPFHSMSIPGNKLLQHTHHGSSNMEIDLLAIYQQQVYDNNQPMMNRNKTNSMYDFVNCKLGETYNNTELLNDFHHLLYHHDKEYEQIYNYLLGQIGTKCVASMCSVLQRNNNEFKIFADQDSVQEIGTRQTINQIHCYFLHSFDIGYRFNEKELKTINQYSGQDEPKSEDNIHDDDETDDGSIFVNSSIDERLSIINKMMHKKHQYIIRKKKMNRSHGHQHHGHAQDQTVFANLQRNYRKYVSIMDHDINKRFLYWDYYKTNMNVDALNGGFMRDWYVKDKYGNLKQELLQNGVCQIGKPMLEYLIERARNLMTCDRSKRLRANSYGNTMLLREYNITKRSPITLDHILTLIVYSSNPNDIQTMFLGTFAPKRSGAGHMNMDQVIVHHSEFANLSRLLRECTEIYGQTLRSSDKFYHLVHGQYLFQDCVFSSSCPLSCTNSLYVACNVLAKYRKNETQNGLILQLSRFETNASFFDCKWLSHFVSEDEKLFFCSSGDLRICTILDIQNSLNYHAYVSGINYLNCLLHGDKDQDSPSKYGKKAMAILIDNELNKSTLLKKKGIHSHYMMQNSNMPPYIDKLFTAYCCDKFKKIEIDVDRINDRYYSLKRHLMTRDDSWINMNLLCTLFVNVQQIVIKDGPYLSDNTFKQLLIFMDSGVIKNNQCKLSKIVFKYPKEEGIGAEEGMKKYYEAIKYRGWDTFYYQGLNDDLITLYFINTKYYLSLAAEVSGVAEMDYFAFELWKTLIRSRIHDFALHREVEGNFLIHHIQQYFPNKFPTDDDILVMIGSLIAFQYISIIYHSDLTVLASRSSVNMNGFNTMGMACDPRDFRYQFEADRCREFVKKSETFRKKWTIGSKVKIFSSHHRAWKNASIVKEIGDILIVSFDRSQHTKTVDRYQQNMITSITFHNEERNKAKIKRRSFGQGGGYQHTSRWSISRRQSNGLRTIQSNSTAGVGGNSIELPLIGSPSVTPSYTTTTGTAVSSGSALQRGSSRVSFGAVLKRPLRSRDSSFTSDTAHSHAYGARHELFHSGVTDQSLANTPRASTTNWNRASALGGRSRRSTHGTDAAVYQPEFAPCRGDPFWDYYRTIGDMSRANCTELIKVMKWISAEDIMRQLLQHWLHSKIEPVELPYANPHSAVYGNFNLHAASVIAFVRQSLNSKQHPNCFDLPELTRYYHDDYDDTEDAAIDSSADIGNAGVMSVLSHSLGATSTDGVESPLNLIGQRIFSFLDQGAFLNSSLVCRAWLFCARSPRARSHIRFRLWNALQFLIRDSDLMFIVEGSNEIVPIKKFMRDRNDIAAASKSQLPTQLQSLLSDEDDGGNKVEGNTLEDAAAEEEEEEDKEEYVANDILIACAAGKAPLGKEKEARDHHGSFRKRSTSHDIRHSFPHFFSSRQSCALFSSIVSLQYDFNIPSHNKLIYYVNQSLVDSYWDTLSILFGCESLRYIDILFPDPHILLAAYILQNSMTYSKYNTALSSKRILFPSIGVPKSKFVCASRHLESVRFAVKSLRLSRLLEMLNTHFSHYYHPVHHKHKYKYHTLDNASYAQYVYAQSKHKLFSKLDIYKLCKKIIHKSLVFDVSNALYSLNHSVGSDHLKPITSIHSLSLCDVKCLNQELATFLSNNCAHLKSIDLMFTHKCILPRFAASTGHTRKFTAYSPHTPLSLSSAHHSVSSSTSCSGAIDSSSIKKQHRIKKTVTELFVGILKYLRVETAVIHDHNHRIKKKFKLEEDHKKHVQITYANKLRVLPLESLSFSFPLEVDISILEGYCQLLAYFSTNECAEISLKNVYFDGGCLTPFTFNNNNVTSLTWQTVLDSQKTNIRTLCMKRILYSSQMFYSAFSDGICAQCEKIDLQIIYSDEYDDAYLHDTDGSRQPIRELLQSLATNCCNLKILYLDFIQHSLPATHKSSQLITMNPSLDILWLDQFVKSRAIRSKMCKFHLTFNEVVTKEYEIRNPDCPKFIRRNHLNLGSILRINPSFQDNIEQLIMSWFGECPQLNQIRLLRHIAPVKDTFAEKHNLSRYPIDRDAEFANNIAPFEQKSKLNIDQSDHKKAFYGVSKRKKVGDFYRGEVFGELGKILQPQNPVE